MKKDTKQGCIYVLTCLPTMKEYVGQAKCWKARWKGHCYAARNDCAYALHTALREQGVENFAVSIIRRCPLDELNYWEEYYIEKFDTKMPYGYNMTEGGDGVRGLLKSDAHREKSRAAMKKFYADNPDVREEMSRLRRGRKTGRKGTKLSVEWRAKLSAAQLRRYQDPAQRAIRSETARSAYVNNPELRVVIGRISKAAWDDPIQRRRLLELRKSPDTVRKLSLAAKAQHARAGHKLT